MANISNKRAIGTERGNGRRLIRDAMNDSVPRLDNLGEADRFLEGDSPPEFTQGENNDLNRPMYTC